MRVPIGIFDRRVPIPVLQSQIDVTSLEQRTEYVQIANRRSEHQRRALNQGCTLARMCRRVVRSSVYSHTPTSVGISAVLKQRADNLVVSFQYREAERGPADTTQVSRMFAAAPSASNARTRPARGLECRVVGIRDGPTAGTGGIGGGGGGSRTPPTFPLIARVSGVSSRDRRRRCRPSRPGR